MFVKKILLKFTSMFLIDFFDYPKIVFYIIKRNAKCLHFRTHINKYYDIYFKIYRCLANFECTNCACKFIISLKLFKYFTLLVGYLQNAAFVTLYHFIHFLNELGDIIGIANVFCQLFSTFGLDLFTHYRFT